MPTITFPETSIVVNDEIVGRLEQVQDEVYIKIQDETVARFKIIEPMKNAKHWLSFMLSHVTASELVECLCQRNTTPIELAESMGYVTLY